MESQSKFTNEDIILNLQALLSSIESCAIKVRGLISIIENQPRQDIILPHHELLIKVRMEQLSEPIENLKKYI